MILKYPDPFLLKKTKRTRIPINAAIVDKFNKVINALSPLGLAANQLGINESIIVAFNRILINPKILKKCNSVESIEECLSLPGKRYKVNRFTNIELEYQDLLGYKNIEYLTGQNAIVIQHEIDHLNGILINEIKI